MGQQRTRRKRREVRVLCESLRGPLPNGRGSVGGYWNRDERFGQLTCIRPIEPDLAVEPGGRERLAVGTEGDGIDPGVVPLACRDKFPGVRVVDSDFGRRACHGDATAVGGPCQSEDRTRLTVEFTDES